MNDNDLKKLAIAINIGIFALILGIFSILNIFSMNSKSFSDDENRELAKIPEFTVKTLTDGTYFKNIDIYISDNFIARDDLIVLSRKIDRFKSFDMIYKKEDSVNIIINHTNGSEVNEALNPFDDDYLAVFNEVKIDETENDTINEVTDNIINETESNEVIDEVPEIAEVDVLPTDEPKTDEFVENIVSVLEEPDDTEPDFLSDGYVIYKNMVFSLPNFSQKHAQAYADTVNLYKQRLPNVTVSVLVCPTLVEMIDNTQIKGAYKSQNSVIKYLYSFLDSSINAVNCRDNLYTHRDEYIYFRSDHHWTGRGAYYAYQDFAVSRGFEPTPIENMEEVLIRDIYHGSMYSMTKDDRVKAFSDEIWAYMPTKKHTYYAIDKNDKRDVLDNMIQKTWRSYVCFSGGDYAFARAEVPENPQEFNIIVIKDSFGNAFAPYLTENFNNVIMIDPRYYKGESIGVLVEKYNISDIIFMNNAFNANVGSWVRNMNRIFP